MSEILDIKKILDDTATQLESALLSKLTGLLPNGIAIAKDYATGAKERLSLLFDLLATGETTIAFVKHRIKDEASLLLAEFLSVEVIAKEIAQEIINDSESIILNSVLGIIKIVLPSNTTTVNASDNNNVNG